MVKRLITCPICGEQFAGEDDYLINMWESHHKKHVTNNILEGD